MLGELGPGEVGFFTAAIKEVAETRVGDTITDEKQATAEKPLEGFKPAQPVVFCGLFPVDAADFEDLRAAMAKLRLNDASFSNSRWRPRRHSASAFAAAFSGSCISRSLPSVLTASSTWN